MLPFRPSLFAAGGAGGGGGGTDPDFASVIMLIGADSSLVDESSYAHTITGANGMAQTTSDQKYGAGCVAGNANTSQITMGDHASLTIGTNNYTWEAWVKAANTTTNLTFFDQFAASGILILRKNGSGGDNKWLVEVREAFAGGSIQPIYANGAHPAAGVWTHVCFDRTAGLWRIYLDGVMILSGSDGNANVGDSNDSQVFLALGNMKLDEYRITNGVARYSSNGGFTPPTGAFPRS
jgi:hypothetical protein